MADLLNLVDVLELAKLLEFAYLLDLAEFLELAELLPWKPYKECQDLNEPKSKVSQFTKTFNFA